MHYLNSFALLALSLPLVAHSKSIYIDSSCTDRAGWNDYWEETMTLAKRSVERINSATDTDFETVWRRIFRAEKGSDDARYAIGK